MSGLRILLHVILKEFLQLRMDPRMLPMLLVAPLVQLVAFGYAANTDVRDIPLLVVDQDRSSASRDLTDRFSGSGFFRIAGAVDDPDEIAAALIRGRAQIALVIGPRFGERIAGRGGAAVQLVADGSDSNSAVVGMNYAARIVSGFGAEVTSRMLEVEPRVWYNPDLRSRWFYVPAVIAMVLMIMTTVLASMGIVREKEIGTMEQLVVTPIRPWQLLVGKLFPFALIGLLDLALVTAIAIYWFEVPLRGSFWLLFGLSSLFLLTTLGMGLLVSTAVRTQQQAMMGSVFLVMIPMIYLSGLIFPIENMPAAIQEFTRIIPLRYYAVIVRGVFLKGATLADLWPEAAMLAIFGVAVTTLAAFRFQKNLD